MTATRWNGEPCEARRITAIVTDDGHFPGYWARDHVGTRRNAVEVTYGGQTFYLDDEDGSGWAKVTSGGSPGHAHRSLNVDLDSVQLRPDAAGTVGYCPSCGRGDVAPTAEAYEQQRQRAERAEAAIARVHALHRKATHGDTCVYCAHGQRLGYDTTWPCDTVRALGESFQAATEATEPTRCCGKPAGALCVHDVPTTEA